MFQIRGNLDFLEFLQKGFITFLESKIMSNEWIVSKCWKVNVGGHQLRSWFIQQVIDRKLAAKKGSASDLSVTQIAKWFCYELGIAKLKGVYGVVVGSEP